MNDSSEHTIDATAELADLRTGPGILILSTDTKLLHMNRRAWELVRQINESQNVKAVGGLLPASVTQICAEIHRRMRVRRESRDWEQIEIRRVAETSDQPVLLRGFGLPGGGNHKARVLIIMERIGRRENTAQPLKHRFQLTNREQTIVQHLVKGLTNKEIAAALHITEPTVKAHIKNIMEKTKCTTRTAIVAQFLHP